MILSKDDPLYPLFSDIQPVIRCRICENKNAEIGGMIHCKSLNKWFRPDFYCADGVYLIKEDTNETERP